MSTYDTMRHFADSWGLLAMFLVFAAVVVRVFMPGVKQQSRDAASIPFKEYSEEDR
jgi:cytochrome c oxidase cbb3-type subunit 4